MYKALTPIKIGSMELKNRIMYLAMAKYLSTPDNYITDRQIAYYENYAKNGVGLIVPGAFIIDPEYPSTLPMQGGLYDDKFIPGLKKLVDAIHSHGSKILLQPWHPGVLTYGCTRDVVKSCSEWSIEEIHGLQKKFVDSILRIQKAGADGCEFHIAHNYLPEQFLVQAFNDRKDEYGADTVENGLRFSTEIIQEVMKQVDENFVITVKINGTDMGIDGGMTPERCAEASVLLEKAGVKMISVSAGGGLSDITGMSGDGYRIEGWKVEIAELVKKAVSIPVVATGSLRHPDYIESILQENKCDMIGLGRGLLADPEWVTKLSEGREDEIKYCISCMHCFNFAPEGKSICAINPLAGRELNAKPIVKDGSSRNVAVIGSGPAGLEAAVTLAKRGFKPVVYERDHVIGGAERLAGVPDGKDKINWHIDYYNREIQRLGIEVNLNTEATVDRIKSIDPCAVLVAAGSKATFPKAVPGILGANVLHARDVLNDFPTFSDKKVVVVGAGQVGLEVARTFASHNNNVTVVDMMTFPEAASVDYSLTFGSCLARNIPVLMEHKLCEITDTSVIVENLQTNEKITLDRDEVVICMGAVPDNTMVDALEENFPNVIKLGDANKIGNICDAVQQGYDYALSIKA